MAKLKGGAMASRNRNSTHVRTADDKRKTAVARKRKEANETNPPQPKGQSESKKKSDAAGKVAEEIDAVLKEVADSKGDLDYDEIEERLEEEAEEFVRSYRQRGGE